MKPWLRWTLTGVLFALGVTFVAVGISLGQNQEVWQKAIRICLECIGIG